MNHKYDYSLLRLYNRISLINPKLLMVLICLGITSARANVDSIKTTLKINTLQSTITGTVTDADGTPLIGANVLVQGTTNGALTDFDGKYSIEAPGDAILVISYVGFVTQEIPVNGNTTIDVALQEDAAALDEVIVVGYTQQTRGDLTGSVASVDLSEATKQPVVNAAEALEGRVTGVTVTNNGSPGGSPIVRIRGFGTPNNNNPLYIIDGVQTDDPSILNTISPSDIAQINVLKDGAASIYGSRASNGVVIITTKNGSYGQNEMKISVEAYTGFATVTNLPDMLNAEQLGNVYFQGLRNDAIRTGEDPNLVTHPQFFPNAGDTPTVPSQLLGASFLGTGEEVTAPVKQPGGTDWLDEIFRVAPTQNANVTISNGNESGRYSFGIGYLNRQGIQLTTQFKRGQIRFNSEYKVGDKFIIGEHANVSFSHSRFGSQTEQALRINPLVPVRDNLGRFAGTYNNNLGLSNANNPVATLLRDGDDFLKQTRILGDIYASYELFDGLKLKTSIGGDLNLFNERDFLALNPESAEPRPTNSLRERNFQSYNWTWTNTLNYIKNFGDHSINALAGLESVQTSGKSLQVSATGFLNETPDFYLLSNADGAPVINQGNTFDFENTLFSIFGAINYSFADRYLLSATLRRDSSSRFGEDFRSGTFPAFSGGWVLSNEEFYPEGALLNRVKFKASWGQLGNQTLPASNPNLNISRTNPALADYGFQGSGGITSGALLTQVGNPEITWEISETFNIGTELSFFDSALSMSLEYFNITTEDLIVTNIAVISDTAIDSNAPFANLGSVENNGFDFAISYLHSTDSDFDFGIDLNISAYENEVTDLNNFAIPGTFFRTGAFNRTEEGQPIAAFYGRQVDGIYRSEEEVQNGPNQGFESPADGVGRLRYVDIDGDGDIDDDDRTFIGNPHPDFTFGLNLTTSYKNWDLSAFFSGSVGNDIYNFDRIYTDFLTFPGSNQSERVLDAFDPVINPGGAAPALSSGILNSETSANSFFIEDGSFVRLKNLSIGYNFPENWTKNWGIDNLRLYLNATNLFTITDYSGFDPEVQPPNGDSTSGLTLGVDNNTFPLSRIFLFGVNLKL